MPAISRGKQSNFSRVTDGPCYVWGSTAMHKICFGWFDACFWELWLWLQHNICFASICCTHQSRVSNSKPSDTQKIVDSKCFCHSSRLRRYRLVQRQRTNPHQMISQMEIPLMWQPVWNPKHVPGLKWTPPLEWPANRHFLIACSAARGQSILYCLWVQCPTLSGRRECWLTFGVAHRHRHRRFEFVHALHTFLCVMCIHFFDASCMDRYTDKVFMCAPGSPKRACLRGKEALPLS